VIEMAARVLNVAKKKLLSTTAAACVNGHLGVCESNPIELIVMVSNIADNLVNIYAHDARRR